MADAALPTFLCFMYVIQVILGVAPGREPSTNIPMDVLCGVQLHVIIPSCTPVDDNSIPLILRLRSQSEDMDTHDQLWVLGFEANVMQVEKFQDVHLFISRMFSVSCAVSQHVTIVVLPRYAACYLVLLAKEQPPEKQHQYPEGVHRMVPMVQPPPLMKNSNAAPDTKASLDGTVCKLHDLIFKIAIPKSKTTKTTSIAINMLLLACKLAESICMQLQEHHEVPWVADISRQLADIKAHLGISCTTQPPQSHPTL